MKKLLFAAVIIVITISCSDQKPITITIESNYTPTDDTCLVALPSNYDQRNNYPLVILLHGWSGDYNQWNTITSLQDYADAYEFVIVCPDGFYDSWYLNNQLDQYVKYDSFFWEDFIPYVLTQYSIDTANIFISGLSMGGHGAINFYLNRPNFFKAAGSTSGILDITAFPENWKIKKVLGTYDNNPSLWEEHSAIFQLDSTKHSNCKMFIDCGTSDFAYNVNFNFVKKCIDLGIDVEFISIPGDHSRKHWEKMIAQHFNFFFNQL